MIPAWLLFLILRDLGPASGDEVALVDWAGVTRRLGPMASSCGLSCHSPEAGRGCSCDPRCRGLGTCCLDYFSLDTEEAGEINITESQDLVTSGHLTCEEVRVSGLLASRHVFMVTSCPRHFRGPPSVAAQCARRPVGSGLYSYSLDIPVTSAASGRVYANLYCAQCHEDAGDLRPQRLSVRCDNTELASQCGLASPDLMTPASYVRGQLRWDTVLANCTPELYVVKCWAWLTSPPPGAASCPPGEVRGCSRPWSHAAALCPLYSLPVIAQDNR